MHRKKGTRNNPQMVKDEILKRHEAGESVPALASAYEMPFKTVQNIIYRERKKRKTLIHFSKHSLRDAA